MDTDDAHVLDGEAQYEDQREHHDDPEMTPYGEFETEPMDPPRVP